VENRGVVFPWNSFLTFKRDLEETFSKELDQRISAHLKNNFLDISTKVTTSFYETSSPFLKRAEEDLQRLHRQGEETLSSWKAMMLQYITKPFILTFLVSGMFYFTLESTLNVLYEVIRSRITIDAC
jgi:hypothetical protein